MKLKKTLYEILGADPGAGLADLQAAFNARMSALEQARNSMAPQAYTDQVQVLRVALNSLSDAAFRWTYDAKLAAARNPVGTPDLGLALVPIPPEATTHASNDIRADALSLRADALSLRADAMMLRSQGVSPRSEPADVARSVAAGTVTGFKYLTRAIGLLVLVAVAAFGLTRCINGDPSERRARLEAKVAEKTVLQEYFQTHGVRPANMAELELLEAERRRRENSERAGSQDKTKAEREARQFEEDARKRGREVSRDLQLAEERAERARQMEVSEQLARERADQAEKKRTQLAEQQRADRQQQQWRDIIQR